MKCPFNCNNKEDNTNFDNPVEHLVMTMSVQGHVHIHGPFSNEYVIRRFADAFMAEMEKNKITYTPPVQHLSGD